MLRRSFLKVSAATVLTGLAARSAAVEAVTTSNLAGDLAIVEQSLALHPGLYRYNSGREMQARTKVFGRDFATAPTIEQRYLLLSRFLATIRCGHTYANFSNQKKAVALNLFDRPTRLPFLFCWADDEMIVTHDPSDTLVRGTRILRINAQTPLAIRDALAPYVRTDGHNKAKVTSLLEVRGDDRFETFDIFQGLLFPPIGERHQFVVEAPGGGTRNVEMPAIGLAARRAQMPSASQEKNGPVWHWALRPDRVAVLTMPSWALYDSKWDWKSWLTDRLDTLGGARGLIVDLRQNEGGQDCGDAILARLINRPFVPPAMEQRLRFQKTASALDPYLDTWDDSFRTLGVGAKSLPDGFFLRPNGDDALSIAPDSKRLGVPLAVLIGPVNSSATFQFASNVRTLGAGKLYGLTTGGNRRGINGGCFFFVRLPASGLEFDLPLVGYFPTTSQPDAGLVPDVIVATGARAIAAGDDPVLTRAANDIVRG